MTPRPSARSNPPVPSPAPEPAPPTPDPHPFFQQPQETAPAPLESPEPAPSWSPSPPSHSPASDDASPSGTRSTAPEGRSPTPLGKAQLKRVGETIFSTVCGFAASVLTHPESIERAEGLWLPDEKEREIVGGALAGIAARRVPAGVAGPDTPDVAALVVGLVSYVGRNLGRRAELRRMYAAAPAPTDDEQAAA